MGALPRLKIKDDLHYRKGSTNESMNCRYCVNFIKDVVVKGIGGIALRTEGRCRIMGMKESIRYRINRDYTCDKQQYAVELGLLQAAGEQERT
jgi:hypothetical protein